MAMLLRGIVAPIIFFIAVSFGSAILANSMANPPPLLTQMPGAETWPKLVDFHARVFEFPLPLIILAAIVLAMAAVIGYAKTLAHEAAIRRDETIREAVRKGKR